MEYIIRPGIKGLIFDLAGTLADTLPYHFKGWKTACEKFGVSIDSSFLRLHSGSPGKLIAAELLKKNGHATAVTAEEIISEKLTQFYSIQHKVKPIEPVAGIVRRYPGILPMAVGTGGHREAVIRTLEITGLLQYFDIIVTSNDVTNYKPHPETFLRCSALMNIEPSAIEVLEDGERGLEAARRAGMIATDVRGWYDSDW